MACPLDEQPYLGHRAMITATQQQPTNIDAALHVVVYSRSNPLRANDSETSTPREFRP